MLEKLFKFELFVQYLVVEVEMGLGKLICLFLWLLYLGRVLVIELRCIVCILLVSFLVNECNEFVGKMIGYVIKLEQYFDVNI